MSAGHDRMDGGTWWSRRGVLRAGAALAAGTPWVVPASAIGANDAVPASERITLGFIGVGGHGHGYNLQTFLNHADAQVVAVCDVFADRRERAKATVKERRGHDCDTYEDFRDLLARADIDAVVISTPDHWHTPMAMLALEAGKDVMCEKPTLTIAEGRELVSKVRETQAVFQTGLEDRSVVYYHRLAELVRNGAIGELERIDVKLPSGTAHPKEEPADVPAGLNWQMWLGPAPFHAFTPNRTEPMWWRQVRDYSGGILADWGAHLLDTAQVANFAEESGPISVVGRGEWADPEESMATMPIEYELDYEYANGVKMHVESGAVAIRFEGTDGWVGNEGWRGSVEASDRELLHLRWSEEETAMWPRPEGEHRNFLDCVKSRDKTTYPAEHHHRLATVMHTGNIAMELDRKLEWDPESEEFPDDAEANALRSREARDWQDRV